MNIKGIIKLFISKSILKKRADHLLDKQREAFYKGCKELLELTDDTLQNADMKLKYEVHFGDWENPENIEYRFEYKNTFIGFNFYKVPVIWQLRVPHFLSQEQILFLESNYSDYRTPIKNFNYKEHATNIREYALDEKKSYMLVYE